MNEDTKGKGQRSKFVTALAWVFIVLCGFASMIGLMQNIMLFFLFQTEELNQGLVEHLGAEHLPEFIKLALTNFQLLAFAVFLVSLASFIPAIGLLKRKNWARIVFIALMSLGILWTLLVFGLQFVIFGSTVIPSGTPELKTMTYIFQAFSVILVAAFIALFAWVIRKLMSSEVRAEFA